MRACISVRIAQLTQLYLNCGTKPVIQNINHSFSQPRVALVISDTIIISVVHLHK